MSKGSAAGSAACFGSAICLTCVAVNGGGMLFGVLAGGMAAMSFIQFLAAVLSDPHQATQAKIEQARKQLNAPAKTGSLYEFPTTKGLGYYGGTDGKPVPPPPPPPPPPQLRPVPTSWIQRS